MAQFLELSRNRIIGLDQVALIEGEGKKVEIYMGVGVDGSLHGMARITLTESETDVLRQWVSANRSTASLNA